MSGVTTLAMNMSAPKRYNEWSFTISAEEWLFSSRYRRGFDPDHGSLLSSSRSDLTLTSFWEWNTGVFPGPETRVFIGVASATPLLPTDKLRLSYLGYETDLTYQGSNYWQANVARSLSMPASGLVSGIVWNVA
jgi:hypothetical protein